MADTKLGFWGAILTPGENYKVTPPEGRVLRISSAALDSSNTDKNASLVIYDPTTTLEHVICTLIPGVLPHSHLDLFFVGNRDVTFKVHGNGNIHLTGYTTFLESSIGAPFDELLHDNRDDSDEEFGVAKTIRDALGMTQEGEEESDEEDDEFISAPMGTSPKITLVSDEDEEASPAAPAQEKKGAKRKNPPQKAEQKQKQQKTAPPTGDKKEKNEKQAKGEKKGKKGKQAASSTTASPTTKPSQPAAKKQQGAVSCSVAGCSSKFNTEAAKAQHMKAKHKVQA